MATKTYVVTGMSCEHCVNAVRSEVSAVPGVTSVDVDLVGGAVTVTASGAVDDGLVATAVDEAGYALAEEPV